MSSTIQIYNGEGADPVCIQAMAREIKDKVDTNLYAIETFKRHDPRPITARQPACIVIPGGYTVAMLKEIAGLASQINEVVISNKASYFGSCAGAILCGSRFISLTHGSKRPTYLSPRDDFVTSSKVHLHSLDIAAPYFTKNSDMSAPENNTSVAVKLDQTFCPNDQTYRFFHNSGPGFFNSRVPGYQPVVHYVTEGNIAADQTAIATILYQGDEGHRLFTGIHPEIGLQDLEHPDMKKDLRYAQNRSYYNLLKEELAPSEQIRHELMKAYLKSLNLKLK